MKPIDPVDRAGAGIRSVSAPALGVTGATGTIQLSMDGLTAGTGYLRSVAHRGSAGIPKPTLVRVDTAL